MSEAIEGTGIWRDMKLAPESLEATIDRTEGIRGVASLLSGDGVRRVIVSGNGASYYVAHALWLAALEGPPGAPEVVAAPGGLIAKGAFRWREGDVLLAISSSGEFRDLVEAIEDPSFSQPFAAVTAHPESTIGRAAGACAVVDVRSQEAITHTLAFCAAVLACLAVWAEVSDDESLRAAVASAPAAVERSLQEAARWAQSDLAQIQIPAAAIAFGTGPAWVAALEVALLLKEVARIPCEGEETREAATGAMTALMPGHLALSLPVRDDPLTAEAEEICRARGAQVLRAPGGEGGDRRLAAITAFPAGLALTVRLALELGHDVDEPDWVRTYYSTARVEP